MFVSGYFCLRNLQLSYIIISVQLRYLLSQSLSIKRDIGHFNTELMCNITGFRTATISFFENDILVVHISNKEGSCQQQPSQLPSHVKCDCKGNINAACSIFVDSYEQYCPKWKCAVPKEGVLHYSNSVDVCNLNVTRLTTKKVANANCSYHIPDRVKWAIYGLNIEYNMIVSTLKTYNAANISSFVQKYQTQTNASIATCKVDNHESKDWSIDILDTSTLCPFDSTMAVNTTCNLTDGNPMVTVIREPNIATPCMSIPTTVMPDIMLPLCEAVNKPYLAAEKFVGNKTGLFKLDILVPASVHQFYVDGFNNQKIIMFNATRQCTFNCRGDGNPPPETKLLKDGYEIGRGNSSLKHQLRLFGSKDFEKYTCVASNALGEDKETIHISYQNEREFHQDGKEDTEDQEDVQSKFFIVGVCAAVAIISISMTFILYIVKRKYKCVSLVRYFRRTATPDRDNELHASNSEMNTGTNYAFFEGNFPEDVLHDNGNVQGNSSSTEIAEMSHAFDNETYSESIKILEKGRGSKKSTDQDQASAFGPHNCSKQSPHYSLDMDTIEDDPLCSGVTQPDTIEDDPLYSGVTQPDAIEDDPLYSGVTQTGPSFAVTAPSRYNATTHIDEPQLRSEDITYSVVKKTKRPKDSTSDVSKHKIPDDSNVNIQKIPDDSTVNKKNIPKDYTYSVVNRKRRPDNCNNSIVSKPKRTPDKHKDAVPSEKTSQESNSDDYVYSVVNKRNYNETGGQAGCSSSSNRAPVVWRVESDSCLYSEVKKNTDTEKSRSTSCLEEQTGC